MSKNIAGVSVLLALLFESTIFAEVPGLGFLIFWVATVTGTILLLHSAERLKFERMGLFLPSLLMAFALFRFDAEVVKIWGSICCLAFLAWAVAWNLVAHWKPGSLASFLPVGSWNPAKLFGHAQESVKVECRWERDTVLQVSRGLIMASLLLLVFGTLLGQADAVFGAKLKAIGNLFGGITPAPMLRAGFWLFLFAGALRLWLLSKAAEAPLTRSFFGPTELFIALGSLNALIVSFLGVQIQYLFGGAELVETLGISHAQYARRGFFELTICIGLILPLVLMAYRSAEVNKDSRPRFLGGGLIFCAFGLAISALRRMFLYIDVYGLSVERFYAAAGIMVAMAILAWAAFICISPRPVSWLITRQKLTVVALLSLLSLVNVDALVATSHLQLVEKGIRPLDTYYLGHLSADALPILEEFEGRVSPQESDQLSYIRNNILQRLPARTGVGFNISRSQAQKYTPPLTSNTSVAEERPQEE